MAKRAKQTKHALKTQVNAFKLMIVAVAIALMITTFCVPARPVVLLHVIALYLHIIAFIVLFALKWGVKHIKGVLALLLSFSYVVVYLLLTNRYSFLNGIPKAFALASLLLGAVTTVALMFSAASTLWHDRRWLGRIGWIALILTFAFIVFLASITHLNYAMGDDTPEALSAEIEDKEYHRNRKSKDRYEFVMTLDGETIDVEVTFAEYHDYEVGDVYTVHRYEGAFGEPFYLAK